MSSVLLSVLMFLRLPETEALVRSCAPHQGLIFTHIFGWTPGVRKSREGFRTPKAEGVVAVATVVVGKGTPFVPAAHG